MQRSGKKKRKRKKPIFSLYKRKQTLATIPFLTITLAPPPPTDYVSTFYVGNNTCHSSQHHQHFSSPTRATFASFLLQPTNFFHFDPKQSTIISPHLQLMAEVLAWFSDLAWFKVQILSFNQVTGSVGNNFFKNQNNIFLFFIQFTNLFSKNK